MWSTPPQGLTARWPKCRLSSVKKQMHFPPERELQGALAGCVSASAAAGPDLVRSAL